MKKAAFTLTEVIVVIVIIAALALILIPNMLSLMPNDHNVKYKKAFYTIEQIVNDIVQECQGMYWKASDNQWKTITEEQAEHVLSYCYDTSNGNPVPKFLPVEICKRLSTTGNCDSLNQYGNDMVGILTTNGMRWGLNNDYKDPDYNSRPLAFNDYNSLYTKSWEHNIYVAVDGCPKCSNNTFNCTENNACILLNNSKTHDLGIYQIKITSTGKVKPGAHGEDKLLLNNPTKD